MFVTMPVFCLSTLAVKFSLTVVFMSPRFSFIFCLKFLSIPCIFLLMVPQQFIVLVCNSTNNARDEKLSMYSFCPIFSDLAVSLVTFAWVAVEQIACFISLPNYTVMLYRIPLRIAKFVNSGQKPLQFLHYIYCLKMTLCIIE